MIGKHCGKMLMTITENKLYFRKQCRVCNVIFKQRKRQAKSNDL